MAAQDHYVSPPEWVIETSGQGSFMVECNCGWYRQGFDTASLARAAAHNHTVTAKGGTPVPVPGDATASTGGADQPAAQKKRWFRRS